MSYIVRFKVGMRVRDTWWPWRLGIVRKVRKTTIEVEWLSGVGRPYTSIYDRAHYQFLKGD